MANKRGSFSGTVSLRVRCLSGGTNCWRLPNSLALDAALIAVCWQSLAAKSLGVELAVTHGLLLAAATWLGYMADRWLDGLSMGERACTDRHLLAVQHRPLLLFAWVLVLLASLCLALETLPVDELSAGFVLAGLCTANAFLAQADGGGSFPVPKELRTALLYSGGISFFISWRLEEASLAFLAIFATVTALCFLNCCFIALWERKVDLRQGQSSLALRCGGGTGILQSAAFVLGGICVGVCALGSAGNMSSLFLAAGCAAFSLPALNLLRLEVEDKRVLADLSLLVPCLVVLVGM